VSQVRVQAVVHIVRVHLVLAVRLANRVQVPVRQVVVHIVHPRLHRVIRVRRAVVLIVQVRVRPVIRVPVVVLASQVRRVHPRHLSHRVVLVLRVAFHRVHPRPRQAIAVRVLAARQVSQVRVAVVRPH